MKLTSVLVNIHLFAGADRVTEQIIFWKIPENASAFREWIVQTTPS
jgi:hypothetical protein